jgi:protein TonB
MKIAARIALLSIVLAPGLFAQKNPEPNPVRPTVINISRGVAEKLLIRKVEPDACPHIPMAARVTAIVVLTFRIDKNGNVLYPYVVSGPKMLRKAALDAIRKYKYKPYIFNGRAVDVDTSISIPIDTIHGCPE